MNNKVYIHEYIDIILQGRPAYMHHMTKGWGSKGRDPKRNMLMVGVWGTLGSTARWPEVINLWEHDGWHGIAKCFKHETGNPLMQDPELKIWWDEAQKYRSGGFDRILIAGEAGSHCVRATVEHLAAHLPSGQLSKLVLLTDCISPVGGFEAQQAEFLAAMQAKGVRLAVSTEV